MSASEGSASSSSATSSTSTGESDEGSGTAATADGSDDGPGSSGESGSACEPTPSDIEGPFYRPGIPIGGNLDVHGELGLPLLLEGRVLDSACSPIAGAIVEIWHATPVAPDGEPGDVNATYDGSVEYRYYGQVATGADGAFAFQTLRPGWYLNGENYRPAHVHLKVWVGNEERLTTQLYFVGDPFNDGDAWFNPEMALDPDDAGLAVLDIVV
jgi:protocatechuate 3,4-dioxygenase beta subunit